MSATQHFVQVFLRRQFSYNVCGNNAVCFAAQNDVPEAAMNDPFSGGEGHIPRCGKTNGANTTISLVSFN
jgi:hypothetical protein